MQTSSAGRKFIGAHFQPCNIYGRLYLNKEGTAYVGNCPKCGQSHRVKAGPKGADVKMVQIFCFYGGAPGRY
ncbi:MAG: Uncharacterized protein E1N59_133 [Puniceicoccaceae bacterium 5H]|nr:MAG: Uncharacterized protein E1N59_133 [Puniceicoccaceae bacterium 5H]